jgi:hypothetical protein
MRGGFQLNRKCKTDPVHTTKPIVNFSLTFVLSHLTKKLNNLLRRRRSRLLMNTPRRRRGVLIN